jgi:TatD DNase family protein
VYINIHTHTPGDHPYDIVNVQQHFDAIPGSGYYSAGLHPWYLGPADPVAGMQQLAGALEKPNVLAVGECGLDKVCKTDYALQQDCFRLQVRLANRCRKPLILHCVRAFEDTRRILKAEQVAVPVIFHGYSKNAVLARQLVQEGYCLSFGKSLWQNGTAAVFKEIALNHVFLETDAAGPDIESVYARAASIKQMTIAELEAAIAANAGRVFGLNLSSYA